MCHRTPAHRSRSHSCPTLDVDAIIAIASYADFTVLEKRMRELGFKESRAEGAPICRWLNEGLVLDLMPTDPAILGFSNRWHRPALEHAQKFQIGDHEIRIISPPYFIATKLEAFRDRGKNDFGMSHDLEDIITVIDGRAELADEISLSEPELKRHLSEEFRTLLENPHFRDALPGLLLPDAASQQRITIVRDRIQRIIDTV